MTVAHGFMFQHCLNEEFGVRLAMCNMHPQFITSLLEIQEFQVRLQP